MVESRVGKLSRCAGSEHISQLYCQSALRDGCPTASQSVMSSKLNLVAACGLDVPTLIMHMYL